MEIVEWWLSDWHWIWMIVFVILIIVGWIAIRLPE